MDMLPLEDPDQPRAELLGKLGIELRTHLAAIKGSAATVLGSSTPLHPDETHHFFRIIDEQANQMHDLINSFFFAPQTDEEIQDPASALVPHPYQTDAPSNRPDAESVRILIIADDPRMLQYIHSTLTEADYIAITTSDPDETGRLIEAEKPHLILLGLTLSGSGKFSLIERISGITAAPVIFLSGQSGEQDAAEAFEAGATDCIIVPFASTELLARVRAALRRGTSASRADIREPYVLKDLTINYNERRVYLADQPVQLTVTEYRLLVELSINAGRVLTHADLLQRVWDPNSPPDIRVLRAFVKNLRHKLGDDARDPVYIFTESRVGYRMANP
jgi:two-component system KDP operon response regulator KdpE